MLIHRSFTASHNFFNVETLIMKKTVAGVVVGLMTLTCGVPSAYSAMPYVSGSVGLASMGDSEHTVRSYDTGYNLAGAVGLSSGRHRVEAEIGHQNNGVKGTPNDLSMTTYMANYYFDLAVPVVPVKPFLVAGAGVANVDGESVGSDRVFAWQIGAGGGFSVFSFATLDLQYRHTGTANPELAGRQYSIGTNNVMLGLRVGL